MVNLKQRSYEEEIMDDLSDNSASLLRALKELDIINKWLGGNAITLNVVEKLISKEQDKVWRIADLGCGSGEMLKRIVEIARKRGVKIEAFGYDANPTVIEYAKDHCKEYPEITFRHQNIFGEEFKSEKFNITLCTLFLHHFKEEELIRLMCQLNMQSEKVVINDLHRHWFAYYSIKWITALFSQSNMVKNDACLSVWRAFKKRELIDILKKAQISQFSLSWKWAFRWKLVY